MGFLILFLLIIANGLFAMSEIAVVSANRVRLEQQAKRGRAAARRALELAEQPNRLLSTTQIGITLIGIFAGAFGGATLAGPLAAALARVAWLAPYAEPLALGVVVIAITYLSLVVGELVPKRIALNNPEGVAMAVAGAMHALAVAATPLVRFLSWSTNALLWLLRVRPRAQSPLSEEEIAILLEQGLQAGVVEPAEHEIIDNAFWIGERRVRSIMTPRLQVAWLDLDDGPEELARLLREKPANYYPLARGSLDEVIGVVPVKKVVVRVLEGEPLDLPSLAEPPLFVPETLPAFDLLARFREHGTHFAIVIDEYGGVEGVVTLSDIVETLLGDVVRVGEVRAPEVVRHEDGSYTLDGLLDLEKVAETLGIPVARFAGEGGYETLGYETLGGFVSERLGHIPQVGEAFTFAGYRFEVRAMDGQRIARVRVWWDKEKQGKGGGGEAHA